MSDRLALAQLRQKLLRISEELCGDSASEKRRLRHRVTETIERIEREQINAIAPTEDFTDLIEEGELLLAAWKTFLN